MMVRSAAKLVSNTALKPSRRNAATILPGHERSRRIAETLAESRPDSRRRLNDDVFGGIFESRQHGFDLIFFHDGAHRADGAALAALDADDIVERDDRKPDRSWY